ncbi:unnamed protein product [Brassica oleracea var. botrytis]|uniref:SNF2 N-terminal domain-containing protein n=2 Tax=Brassica TaxID=3705 RepID=A0A3P6ERG8_BRAOL|nr:unnamed protein product [Brassica napus]VDD39966.1 unnamed protein product [Brassica oleracea]
MKFLGMFALCNYIVLFVLFQESLLLFSVLFTTYDIALLDQDFLSQILWQYTVIDEAQILKNPNRLSRKRWE